MITFKHIPCITMYLHLCTTLFLHVFFRCPKPIPSSSVEASGQAFFTTMITGMNVLLHHFTLGTGFVTFVQFRRSQNFGNG